MKRLPCLVLACLLWVGWARAEDAVPQINVTGPNFPDLFEPSRARAPKPGEWLEFRVAFPVDPLENRLRSDPAPVPGPTPRRENGAEVPVGDSTMWVRPVMEPEQAWRVIPLRLEIREVTADGCHAVVTYEGGSNDVYLPAAPERASPPFHYTSDGDGLTRRLVPFAGNTLEVEVHERRGDGVGFVRWFSPTLPFGIFRFATADVDLLLVGAGIGMVPDFPMRWEAVVDPPLGLLYAGSTVSE